MTRRTIFSLRLWLWVMVCITLMACSEDSTQSADEDSDEPEPESFTVSTEIAENGTVEPGQQTLSAGESASFTISPTLGFEIASVTGCDGTLTDTVYQTGPVSESCTVVITFAPTLSKPEWLPIEGEDERVALNWEAVDGADLYRVYYSQSPNVLPGHGTVQETDTENTSVAVTGLDNGTTYYFALEARSLEGFGSELSDEVQAVPFPTARPAFNDTGFDQCGNGASTSSLGACPLADYPDQDGDHGRDAAAQAGELDKFGDGEAGFDFTRLTAQGDVQSNPSSDDFACVRDNVTGLTWEVKTNDGGLHHVGHTYSWYSDDAASNGGEPGVEDEGSCFGSACDTQAFADAVNDNRLCGFDNWRLPTIIELQSIVHYGNSDSPRIDQTYFPNAGSHEYWSNQTLVRTLENARILNFEHGRFQVSDHVNKSLDRRVRLVRSPITNSD